jgi:hypothetical protein
MSLTKSLAKVDNTLTDNFKNKNFVNGFRIACGICFFLLLQAKPRDLQFVNNLFFRLAYLCLVAYVMMIDTMSSVVLAGIFVVAVYVANSKNTLAMDLTGHNTLMPTNTSNNTTIMEKILEPSFDDNSHPAYQTLTENIETGFTTSSQFKDAQDNRIPGSGQETSVKTFVKQHGVQGLDFPRGFDDEDYRGYPLQ